MLNKIKSIFSNELIIFGLIYFFLSYINLRTKLFLTPDWFNGILTRNHNLLLNFEYTNNEQSRLFQFLIPEFFTHFFNISIEHAYILQRWLFTFLTFICFHKYLRKWFSKQESFSGVLFLTTIMQLTFANELQESSSFLLLTFLLGLWAIREKQILPILITFFIGGLNNETMLFLPIVYFFYNFTGFSFKKLAYLSIKTIIISIPLIITIGPIRYITRHHEHLGGAYHLPDNLQGIISHAQYKFLDLFMACYLYIFFIFGAFWLYTFFDFKNKPLFLRRASLMIPFFLAGHLITGKIMEVRQMLPLSFIIIPMSLFYIFTKSKTE